MTDDKRHQGNCIDSSRRCAHSILQEPQVRNLIKLDPMTSVHPDNYVQPTGMIGLLASLPHRVPYAILEMHS